MRTIAVVVGIGVERDDPTEHEEVVAHLVDVLDLAVDPGNGAFDDRRAGDAAVPGDVVEPRVLVAGLGELPTQVGLRPRRTFTQNRSEGAIASHVMLFVIGRNPTIGGSSDTDVNEPIVNPAGWSPFMPVTIVTPVGKCPRTVRNCFGSMAGASGIALDRRGRAPSSGLTLSAWTAPRSSDRKRALRREMRALRRALPDREERSQRLWERVQALPAVEAANVVMVFDSMPGEPVTAPFIAWCREHGQDRAPSRGRTAARTRARSTS